jgi:hypothetical protein
MIMTMWSTMLENYNPKGPLPKTAVQLKFSKNVRKHNLDKLNVNNKNANRSSWISKTN